MREQLETQVDFIIRQWEQQDDYIYSAVRNEVITQTELRTWAEFITIVRWTYESLGPKRGIDPHTLNSKYVTGLAEEAYAVIMGMPLEAVQEQLADIRKRTNPYNSYNGLKVETTSLN